MRPRVLAVLIGLAAAASPFCVSAIDAKLGAEAIVRKNAEARGGQESWCKVKTLAWAGHMESGRMPLRSIPFVLEQKRPNKVRFEMNAMNQRTVRAFDGTVGWKLLPSGNGRPEIHDYRPDELRYMHEGVFFDAPLVDCQGKGNKVVLEGEETVQGHPAYRLVVMVPGGAPTRVWIDAETFLEIKAERETRSQSGTAGVVSMLYREYQTFDGLRLPTVLESGSTPEQPANRMVVDKVLLNPELDDDVFAKPKPHRKHGVVVDTRASGTPDGSPGSGGPASSAASSR